MFQRRQKHIGQTPHPDVINVEEYQLKNPVPSQKDWFPELSLTKSDRDVMLSPTAWLTDSVVNAAQTLMKKANLSFLL